MIARALAALVLVLASVATEAASDDLAECEVRAAAGEDYRCVWIWSRRSGDRAAALEAVERLMQRNDDPRLVLARAAILDDDRDPRAVPAYEQAAEDCRSRELWRCVVIARVALTYLGWAGRTAAQIAQDLADAESAAARSEVAEDLGRVAMARGWEHWRAERWGEARTAFARAAAEVFPEGPFYLQNASLGGLGSVAWRVGRFDEARAHWLRQLELVRRLGDPLLEAGVLHNLVLAEVNLFDGDSGERARRRIDEASSVVRNSGSLAQLPGLLAMRAQTFEGPAETVPAWNEALRLATEQRDFGTAARAHRFLALEGYLLDGSLDRAEAHLAAAREVLAGRSEDGRIATCLVRGELLWLAGAAGKAAEQIDECFDWIDDLRARQPTGEDRALTVAGFFHVARYCADAALSVGPGIEVAFRCLERLRGRSLAEELNLPPVEDPSAELYEVRRSLSLLQRQLAEEGSAERSAELVGELERAEAREAELLRASHPEVAPLEVPTLAEVQQLLDPDELILELSIGLPPPRGHRSTGSWALVIDRQRIDAVALPLASELEPAVRAFVGLAREDDLLARRAAVRLYDLLLRAALTSRPEVRRLIVVPDGIVHELPLAALREAEDAPPLVSRLSVERVPSATLWSLLRRRRVLAGEPPPVRVLAVAAAEGSAGERSGLRSVPGDVSWNLGPLPAARREAERLASAYAPRGELLGGSRATERAVLTALSRPLSVVHFASHAVVDARRPQRSAVVLRPDDDDDGLLQPRDLAGLSLGGAVVLLSACSSADGTLVPGEGVFGLSRAFLAAGAGAVVGNLLPVSDDAAACLMGRLHRGLRRGRSLAEALAIAQQGLASEGRPPADWANAILVGDGRIRLRRRQRPRALPVLLGVFVVASLAAVTLRKAWSRSAAWW